MEDITIFSTRYLAFAAALVTMGFPVIRVDYQFEGGKQKPIGYFAFEDSEQLRDIRQQYNQGFLRVEPRTYMSNMQSLKSEVTNYEFNPTSKFNQTQ